MDIDGWITETDRCDNNSWIMKDVSLTVWLWDVQFDFIIGIDHDTPANTRRSAYVGLMVSPRRRRWGKIESI